MNAADLNRSIAPEIAVLVDMMLGDGYDTGTRGALLVKIETMILEEIDKGAISENQDARNEKSKSKNVTQEKLVLGRLPQAVQGRLKDELVDIINAEKTRKVPLARSMQSAV